MPSILGQTAIATAGLAMLVWLLTHAWWRPSNLSPAGLVVLGTGAVACAPPVIGDLAGGYSRETDVFGDSYVQQTSTIQVLSRGLLIAFLILMAILLMRAFILSRGRIENPLALALLVAAFATDIGDYVHGRSPSLHGSGAVALTLGALIFLRSSERRGLLLAAGAVPALVGATSSIVALTAPERAWALCRPDKCGPFGMLFDGSLYNENALGLIMALAVPFAALQKSRLAAISLTSSCLIFVAASGSRTAMVAALAALVVVGVSSLSKSHRDMRRRVVGAIAVTGVSLGLLLPLLTESSNGYSARGTLWQLARSGIAKDPWVGHGANGWRDLYQSTGSISSVATYSAHNEWLDLAYSAGLIGCGIVLCVIVAIHGKQRPLAGLLFAPVAWASILERPWSLTDIDWLSWSMVAIVLAARPARQQNPPHSQLEIRDGRQPCHSMN